jgi:predicted CoA-binding protein
MSKKTMVIGAVANPERYAYMAIEKLQIFGHEVIPLGIRVGEINGLKIIDNRPVIKDIHTVTLYINAERQKDWYEYIIALSPSRVIFNPGTENIEFVNILKAHEIEVEIACTLVMLSVDIY